MKSGYVCSNESFMRALILFPQLIQRSLIVTSLGKEQVDFKRQGKAFYPL